MGSAVDSSRVNPLPQDLHRPQMLRSPCGSGHAREEAGPAIQDGQAAHQSDHYTLATQIIVIRGLARSHRICIGLKCYAVPVGAGLPAKRPPSHTRWPGRPINQTSTPWLRR
ncbi:hypothetical protein D0O09_22600 [Pseudomonas putida]|nr:hypothetical protein D0O09_22600 [Pseudomonas putida]